MKLPQMRPLDEDEDKEPPRPTGRLGRLMDRRDKAEYYLFSRPILLVLVALLIMITVMVCYYGGLYTVFHGAK